MPLRESSSFLNRIKDDVIRDDWYARVFPYVPRVNFTQPIVVPPFWNRMMSDASVHEHGYSHEHMIAYQLRHIYNGVIEIKDVPTYNIGRGLYVALGHDLPAGFRFGMWGAIGLGSRSEFIAIQPERLVDLYMSEYGGLYFMIHPACIPGFINSSRGYMSRMQNCTLHVVEQCYRNYGIVRWKKDVYIKTTRRIRGGEQLLFDYDYGEL